MAERRRRPRQTSAGAIEHDGFTPLGIITAHLIVLADLPLHPDHRDPFDHLLIGQAIAEGATFISEDRRAANYAVPLVTCSDGEG